MPTFIFERLNAWNESQEFASTLYKLVNKMPKSEEFGLKSQLKRAGLSIALNIAEGHSRNIGKEQANFFRYAYGSLMEVISGMFLAKKLGYISEDELDDVKQSAEKLAKMISGLRRSTLKRGS